MDMNVQLLSRLLRFGAVGIFNTAFGYAIYFGLVRLGLLPEIALLIATVLGAIFNFFTTGRLVFGNADNGLFLRFVAAYAAVYFVNAAVLRLAIGLGADPLVAQAVILPFSTLGTFVVMRVLVFREAKP